MRKVIAIGSLALVAVCGCGPNRTGARYGDPAFTDLGIYKYNLDRLPHGRYELVCQTGGSDQSIMVIEVSGPGHVLYVQEWSGDSLRIVHYEPRPGGGSSIAHHVIADPLLGAEFRSGLLQVHGGPTNELMIGHRRDWPDNHRLILRRL